MKAIVRYRDGEDRIVEKAIEYHSFEAAGGVMLFRADASSGGAQLLIPQHAFIEMVPVTEPK